jgi:signal transduction histidine kinase
MHQDAGDSESRPYQERGRVEGAFLTIAVKDTGGGMTSEELERIFEPFFSTKRHGMGTGLGMSIVEDIVRAHQAAIRVSSAKGEGTTVRLQWPLVREGAPIAHESSTRKAEAARES